MFDLKIFIYLLLFFSSLFAETIDCTKVFEERKSEILKEVEKIDEARQSFEALKAATNALFDKQRESLEAQKADVNATLQKISEKEEAIKKMLEENQRLLEAINGAKNDKMSTTYEKMKDGAAAAIIEAMPEHEAASILFSLSAKKVSTIMSKMDPQIASNITQILKIGPPFEAKKEQKEQ